MRQDPLIRAGLATLGLLLFLVAVGPGWAQEDLAIGVAPAGPKDNTIELQKVRAEIKRQQDLIRSLNAQAADARRDHEAIAQEIELHTPYGRHGPQGVAAAVRKPAPRGGTRQSRGYLRGCRLALSRSLRRMYVRGQRNELEMILTAGSFSELMSSVKLERTLARLNAGLVERTRREGAGRGAGAPRPRGGPDRDPPGARGERAADVAPPGPPGRAGGLAAAAGRPAPGREQPAPGTVAQ